MADLPRLLRLGLGRAIPLVRRHYDPSYRDVILNACLHLLAMDRQVEGTRSQYMFEIIEATGELPFYRDAIFDAFRQLDDSADDYDIQQICMIVYQFADRGDAEARQILIDRFLAVPAFCDFITADILIWLDGVDGFIFVAGHLSELMRLHGEEFLLGQTDHTLGADLFNNFQEAIGEAELDALWPQFQRDHPDLQPVFDQIERWRSRKPSKRRKREQIPYDQFRKQLQERKKEPVFYECRLWGRGATDDELRRTAEDLLIETDPQQLRRYLGIFQDRPFPLDLTKLMSLAGGSTEAIDPAALETLAEVRWPSLVIASINALSIIQSPRVRAFALEQIERGFEVGRMAGLLAQNDQAGDWALVEPLTHRALDDEDYHSLGWSLIDLFDARQIAEAVPALLNLYERNPCGPCRERVVARLHWLDALPDWMREECLLDSYDSLRECMANDFADYRE